MHPYLLLAIAALLPVAASVILYLLNKNTAFGKLSRNLRQIVYGIVFGLIAIFGTEHGVKLDGVVMNVRDAAPVCAGLIFGAPAGVIAGLIGGIERFIAAPWVGEYTKYACSIGTVFAGFFAGTLRIYLFDNKKPAWYYGLATGVIAEVIHMLLIFLWNIKDARGGFAVVHACAIPMIAFCGASVMLANMAVAYLGREKYKKPQEKTSITQTFQRKLLWCVLTAFVITGAFTYLVQNSASKNQVDSIMRINLADVKSDVSDATDISLLNIAKIMAEELDDMEVIDSAGVTNLAHRHDIVEINVIGTDGIIYASTDKNNVGFDMSSGEQAAEFLQLLDDDVNEFVQAYSPLSRDSSIMRKYAGVSLKNGDFVQVAYDGEDIHRDAEKQVADSVVNRHAGESGFFIICDENFNIVTDPQNLTGQNLGATGISTEDKKVDEYTRFEAEIYGEECYCMFTTTEGYYIIVAMPVSEAIFSRDSSLYFSIFMEVLIFTALFILVYYLIKKLVVNNIRKVNDSLAEITGGNLDVTVDVRTNEEFASLSDDINSTVTTLKHYIDEAAARIDKELEFAKTIQESALPRIFPPYPNRKDFDIWADMDPAKEVGGDFYDFYFVGENKFAFLVADVSGKGIPAAMFMMTAKTLIKSLAETGAEVNEILTHANQELCESNEAGMFVTAWIGIIDLKTGLVSFSNAGHNPPLVRKKNGEFTYLRSKPGFVLAGMEGVRYRKNEVCLEPGDVIFLYTDGVTEATNASSELYGEERLEKKLNSLYTADVEVLCRGVKSDIDVFVGEAPQFDDITMLCFSYKGEDEGKTMKELTVEATIENIETVTEFVDGQLEALGCGMKAETQINIAIDELFSNIARYAYNPDVGSATVRVEVEEDPMAVIITFIDNGMPYDPLKSMDPDTNLPAEDREVGGLGIFIVKKTMDEVTYEYKDGKNILKIKKEI
ncbi:MAG: SpoIIE family protein phosphatase [Bacillota bacterium]|nr:SpoIIE family protein phosphatase [Bacillota bacterium]